MACLLHLFKCKKKIPNNYYINRALNCISNMLLIEKSKFKFIRSYNNNYHYNIDNKYGAKFIYLPDRIVIELYTDIKHSILVYRININKFISNYFIWNNNPFNDNLTPGWQKKQVLNFARKHFKPRIIKSNYKTHIIKKNIIEYYFPFCVSHNFIIFNNKSIYKIYNKKLDSPIKVNIKWNTKYFRSEYFFLNCL
jgi:hypothetical protein